MRRLALLPLMLPLLLGAGCARDQNLTLSPAAAPVVSRTDYVIDLTAASDTLAYGERQRLAGWLEGLRLGRGDSVSVDAPRSPARDAIAETVGGYGILLTPDVPVSTGSAPAGAVRVVVSRASATVPGCPDWSGETGSPSSGATSRNYGCATLSNMAAMIADPQDLLRGRADRGGSDPRTSVKAIKVWRDLPPSGEAALKKVIVQEASTGGN